MVTSYKLHKLSGITAGVVLFILAVSGFVLDHDYWNSFYSVRFTTDSKELLEKERRLVTSKIVTNDEVIVATMRGVYEKEAGVFQERLSIPVMGLFQNKQSVFAATSDGIYVKKEDRWLPFALKGKVVTAISGDGKNLVAIVDKSELILLDYDGNILKQSDVEIKSDRLQKEITLSRFLRDLHYGRGLFDSGFSLFLNDYAAVVLAFLALSGYVIWYLIFRKKAGKKARLLIKLHANSATIVALPFMLILSVSGIYLDHASFFGKYTKQIAISHTFLPPIYSTLKEDIWSVALYNNRYYIGNRVGVYASEDLHNWELVSNGFGYSLSKLNDKLYIGGMGSPNRVCNNNGCKLLPNTPHMFKQAYIKDGKINFLSSHTLKEVPVFKDISLYTLMLALHDGSFFASWWIWINDIAAVLLLLLMVTGVYRWWKKSTRHR